MRQIKLESVQEKLRCKLLKRSSFLVSSMVLIALNIRLLDTPVAAQEVLTAEQLASGRAELLHLLKSRPRAELEEMKYLMPCDSIENATLGEPYAFYRLETGKVRSLRDYRLFKECLTFIMWDIPVSFGGETRLLLGVTKRDGRWQLAHYGKDPTMIEKARSCWPKNKGYALSFVMEVGGPTYIMVERKGNIWLSPLMRRDEKLLNVTKDRSGRYPLLTIPYVLKKLQARPEMLFDPKME
jgi:hypothetical protein